MKKINAFGLAGGVVLTIILLDSIVGRNCWMTLGGMVILPLYVYFVASSWDAT